MTKKDYKIIAEALRQVIGGNYVDVVDSIAKALAEDNPRFDLDKFYDACGIEPKYCEHCRVKPSMSMQAAENWRCPHCGSK